MENSYIQCNKTKKKTGAVCVAPPCVGEAVGSRGEVVGSRPNVWPVFPQEGSGFDDFDSDDEVLRVSSCCWIFTSITSSSSYKRNILLTSQFFFLSRGRRVLVDPQDCRGPLAPRLETSSLDHPVLLGEMAGMESAAQPAHL